MQGWARLNPQQRERFFQAGLKAALRLDRLEFRAWLLRQEPAARRSGRSGALCNFGSRYGLAAENIGRRAAPRSPALAHRYPYAAQRGRTAETLRGFWDGRHVERYALLQQAVDLPAQHHGRPRTRSQPYLAHHRHGARRQRLPLALPKEKLSGDFKRRKCGWSGLPHYRAREKDKRVDALRDRCITQARLDQINRSD